MIKKAKISDSPKIELLMKSVKNFWDDSWRKDVIKLGIKASKGLSFVYEENGDILGFICAHDIGFRAYLSELIVSPKIQDQGVGKKLLCKVEEKLQEGGCKILISDVWQNSTRFYSKLGWSEPNVKFLRKKL